MPAAGDNLGDTATVAGWGRHGWHYTDAAGAPQHQKATLIDRPRLPGRGNNSKQVFETAALAVEGRQQGSYMGSVEWGWEGRRRRRPRVAAASSSKQPRVRSRPRANEPGGGEVALSWLPYPRP